MSRRLCIEFPGPYSHAMKLGLAYPERKLLYRDPIFDPLGEVARFFRRDPEVMSQGLRRVEERLTQLPYCFD